MAVILVGNRLGRTRGGGVEAMLWVVVATALIVARAAFVMRFAAAYAASPLSILDIRDGGFDVWPGVAAGLGAAALIAWRARARRVPVMAGAAAGAAVLALAALVEATWAPDEVRLPQVVLSRLEGGTLHTGTLEGRPLVINIWASWCPPCRREMPVLRQAQLEHPEITFLFLNQAEARATIKAYVDQHQPGLANVVSDPGGAIAAAYKVRGLPTTLFFDSRGRLLSSRTGEVSAATLAQRLEGLHGAHPAGAR